VGGYGVYGGFRLALAGDQLRHLRRRYPHGLLSGPAGGPGILGVDHGVQDAGPFRSALENIGSDSPFSPDSREKYFEICKKIVCIWWEMGIQ
jgi:hypothetical protein